MIAVGLPEIARHLHVTRGTAASLITSYLVAMLGFQPFAGRLADKVGIRRVATGALGGFALASVGAGLAPSFGALLVARCVQAAFGAALIPTAQASLRSVVGEDHRGRAFGIFAAGIGVGAAVGPLLGGVLVDVASWRAIFMVNFPLALSTLPLIPRPRAATASPAAGGSWRALRRAPFVAACATQATGNFALVLSDRGWHGSRVGLAVSGLTAGMVVLAPAGGRMGDRRGRAPATTAGMAVVTLGCIVLAIAVAAPAGMVVGALVMGAGMGLSNASLQASAVEAVPADVVGAAAGIFSTSRYVGSIAGSVLIGAADVAGARGARPVLVVAAVVAAVATLTATQLGGGRRRGRRRPIDALTGI